MKTDREHKQARMGEHLPGFPGYSALDHRETDRQFRRLLAGELEKVRDRLAEFLAAMTPGGKRAAASLLRETAALREKFLAPMEATLAPPDEERLLDFDLALLDRIAALHTPLDHMETAAAPGELAAAFDLFHEGLAEVAELFDRRGEEFSGRGKGR